MITKNKQIDSEKKNLFGFPKCWKMQKLKYVTEKILDGTHFTPDYIEAGVPFLRVTDIQTEEIDLSKVKYISQEEHETLCKRVRPEKGDVLLSKNGTIGIIKVINWNWEFSIFVSLCLIRLQKNINPYYFAYYFGSDVVEQQLFESSKKTSVNNLHLVKIRELLISVPSVQEQNRILHYLNNICGSIDTAIDIKQKQLEILDDLKKSTIHKAVTQGVDDAVEMKDSGVEWLGKISKHWKVKRIKDITQILRGKFTHRPRNDPSFYGGEYPFIQTGEVTGAKKFILSYRQTLNDNGYRVSKEFPKGTLVMTIAANIGDVAILDFKACFPDSIVGFYPGHKTDVNYLYYLFTCMRPALLSTAILTTQLNLNNVKIGSLYSVFPPKSEQIKIACHLDKKISQIEKLKKNIVKQIETLELYRKSIIHECVTGKRRITQNDLKE